MKQIVTILMLCLVTITFGQERKNAFGLNRFIPDNISAGLKGQANYYMPSFSANSSNAASHEFNSKEFISGGGGIYARWDLKDHFSFQPEVNFQYRRGSVNDDQTFITDTFLVVLKEKMTNYQSVTCEIPLNAKWRWELINVGSGHWKANSAIGLFIGPRVGLAVYSRQTVSKATTTTAYDQIASRDYEVSAPNATVKYAPLATMGIGAGVDFELSYGLILQASYYRGLLSHSLKSNGYKTYDNRFEFGIGVRFK